LKDKATVSTSADNLLKLVESNDTEEQAPFFFDDFFVEADDPGVEVTVQMRGRNIPLRIARGLTLRDMAESESAAITSHIDAQGRQVIDSLDSTKAAVELLFRAIKSWPFTFRDGRPVPVTREHIEQMLGEGAMSLATRIKASVEAKEEALAPFA
jgi:hypothetical protein